MQMGAWHTVELFCLSVPVHPHPPGLARCSRGKADALQNWTPGRD